MFEQYFWFLIFISAQNEISAKAENLSYLQNNMWIISSICGFDEIIHSAVNESQRLIRYWKLFFDVTDLYIEICRYFFCSVKDHQKLYCN